MTKIILAHAPDEEPLAEHVAKALLSVNYEVVHRGTVLVGESYEEAFRQHLSQRFPVVLCGTINAIGTGWARRIVNSAVAQGVSVFPIKLQASADMTSLMNSDLKVIDCSDLNFDKGIRQLIEDLRILYPADNRNSLPPPEELLASESYLDMLTPETQYSDGAVASLRARLRDEARTQFPDLLPHSTFLERIGVMRDGKLTLAGLLLFPAFPSRFTPSAITKCSIYTGNKISGMAAVKKIDLEGPIQNQIDQAYNFILTNIDKREFRNPDRAGLEVEYQYPVRCLREIIVNALCHRDYTDTSRVVQIRLFNDRIEMASPGCWFGGKLEDGKEYSLRDLEGVSMLRNPTLARVIYNIYLFEGRGEGIPTSIEECEQIGAPIPTVVEKMQHVTVTVRPRTEWETVKRAAMLTWEGTEVVMDESDVLSSSSESLKPAIRRSSHILPFGELSALEFERLCLWLVEREGYLRAEHIGQAGSDQGHDIIAYKQTDTGEHLWLFQCKRYQKVGTATLIAEVDKYNQLAAADPAHKPAGIVFVTSAALSATARQQVRLHCTRQGYETEFWTRIELDMRVKKHPEIVNEFFDLPVAPAVSALHQLPAPPADFTGRQGELDELLGRINEGSVTISGLQGLGGIGKTALALKLAESLTSRYTDAQFYLDLKGTSPQPLTAADVQAHVIRAFHPTAKVPESEAELTGLYRSVLHGKRVLLVMDNTAGSWQVAPLIPPSGCAMIVTSRLRFTVPGLYAKDLGTLPEEDAHRLLLTIAPRIGEEAGRISELCGRLPLALRLAASALAEKANLSPRDYARRLERAGERLSLVDASLSLSYDLLDEDIQSRWRQLGIFSSTFNVEAAASMWEMEQDEAADLLSELIKYSLVDYDAGSGRYSLHDLVRVFTQSKLPNRILSDSKYRHAEYYLNVLSSCESLYLRGGKDVIVGLALFDLERNNIEAGQAWTASRISDEERARRLCSLYPETGINLLNLRLHPHERIGWLEAALQAAKLMKDVAAEGAHFGNLGLAYAELGEPRKAIEYHEQALVILREIGDLQGEGNALGNLGLAYADLGESRKAIEYHEANLAIVRRIGNRRDEGNALGNLGGAYYWLGEVGRAIEFYEQQLAIARDLGDRRGEGTALGNLGLAYSALSEVRRAIEFNQQALIILRDLGDRRGEGIVLGNLGNAYTAIGEVGRAIEFYEQQLAFARDLGDRYGEGTGLGNLGIAYLNLGQPRRAIEFYEQALIIDREVGDRRGEGAVLGNLGTSYAELGDARKAIKFYEQALIIDREVGDRRGEGEALGNLGIAYKNLGEVRSAIEFYEQQLVITREIGDRRGEATALYNMGFALHTLGQQEKAIACMEAALALFEQIESPHAATVRERLAKWLTSKQE